MALFGKKKDKTIDLTARYLKQQERLSNMRENMKTPEPPSSTTPISPRPKPQTYNPYPQAGNSFGFLDNVASQSSQSPPQNTPSYQKSPSYPSPTPPNNFYPNSTSTGSDSEEEPEEKRKKLAKRLMDITDRLEEVSNQIYHLQQRVEVLEKKFNPNGQSY